MFIALYCVLTAAGSFAIAALLRRWLRLDWSLGTLCALMLLALCATAVVGILVGASGVRGARVLVSLGQIVAIFRFVMRQPLDDLSDLRNSLPPFPRTPMPRVAAAAVALALAFSFVCAFAPVTSWDAGVAHMALPAIYTTQNRIGIVDGNNYSGYPQLAHTLFTLALALGAPRGDQPPLEQYGHIERNEASVALTVWFVGVLAIGLAWEIGARLGAPSCGPLAAAVLATAPIFHDQASTPSIDLAYTATLLAALRALLLWQREHRWAGLVLAAMLAGCGCGIRHTAYLANALLLIGVVLTAPRARVRSGLAFAAITLLFAAPWLFHSWRVSGNPVYPFLASIMPTPELPDVDVASVGSHSSIQGSGLTHLLLFPWSLAMNPSRYGGWSTSLGGAWLVLGLVGLITGGRAARAFGAFSAGGLFALFFFQRFARYAFPFATPMMLLAALPFETMPRLRHIVSVALLLSFLVGLAPGAAATLVKLPVVVGAQSRGDYLRARVERYSAMEWFPQEVAGPYPSYRILSLDPRSYYFNQPVYVNFEALKRIAQAPVNTQREWLQINNIRFILYPEGYVKKSPAFRETGVGAMLDAWRADREHFTVVKTFDLPDPRGGPDERVEIYEFRD